VLSNTSIDQLSIQYGDTQTFVQGRSDGLKAPGAVAVADFNGDGNLDIIVLDKGANDFLVYLGLGGNRFAAPQRYFTGTEPEGLTIADLTGDGVPDLIIANQGSDDLSIFIGVGRGANWQLTPGPRVRLADPPYSTTVADLTGNGIPEIIAVSRVDNTVTVLRGTGGGFFDDVAPLVLPSGEGPIRAFVGEFDAGPGLDLAVLDSGSSDFTYYSNFEQGTARPLFIPTEGMDPIAGVMEYAGLDAYADLFVAHAGDTRIAVFNGGASGLVLSHFVSLGSSAQPTDLAISVDRTGVLYLYISAEASDQVVFFAVTLGWALPAPEAVARESLPLSTQVLGGESRDGSFWTAPSFFSVEAPSTGAGAQQQQALVQATTTPAGPAGALGGVSVAVGAAASLPTIINVSLGSPTFFNNFVVAAQVQISEIMPLGNGAMDSVAVLLVVSGTSVGELVHADAPRQGESEVGSSAAIAPAWREDRRSHAGSNLERFLLGVESNWDDDVEREAFATSAKPSPSHPDWIWELSTVDLVGATAAVDGGRSVRPSCSETGSKLHSGANRDAIADDSPWVILSLDAENLPPVTVSETDAGVSQLAPLVAVPMVISSLVLGIRVFWKRPRTTALLPPSHSVLAIRPKRVADLDRKGIRRTNPITR